MDNGEESYESIGYSSAIFPWARVMCTLQSDSLCGPLLRPPAQHNQTNLHRPITQVVNTRYNIKSTRSRVRVSSYLSLSLLSVYLRISASISDGEHEKKLGFFNYFQPIESPLISSSSFRSSRRRTAMRSASTSSKVSPNFRNPKAPIFRLKTLILTVFVGFQRGFCTRRRTTTSRSTR